MGQLPDDDSVGPADTAQPLPYRLRIGVTGHRELSDPAAVAEAVDRLLNQLNASMRNTDRWLGEDRGAGTAGRSWLATLPTRMIALLWPGLLRQRFKSRELVPTPVEWAVCSSLAKGADRIVARAVLKVSSLPGPQKLRAILPLPADDYRKDFTTAEDRDEFESLLALAPDSRVAAEDSAGSSSDRNEAYFKAGREVVDDCDLLIAIWNGKQGSGPGGTADVVRYAVEVGRTVIWLDANIPGNPVRVITRIHGDEPLEKDEAITLGLVHRVMKGSDPLDENFKALAYYNQDPMFDRTRYEQLVADKKRTLLQAARDTGLRDASVRPMWDQILPHYVRAELLALDYQLLYMRAARWLHYLSAAAVTVAVAQWMFDLPKGVITLEILAMILALCLLFAGRREQWHEKWLRDRHLAERWRILLYTSLAGCDNATTNRTLHESLPYYRQPEDWVLQVTDCLAARASAALKEPLPFEQLRLFIVMNWLKAQAAFHRDTAASRRRRAHLAHSLGILFFSGTLLMALLHLLGVGHAEHHDSASSHGTWLSCAITSLAIILPAWGAAIHSVSSLLDHDRIAERSQRMAALLDNLAIRMRQTSTPEELTQEVQRAAMLMMNENHEWRVSMSFRGLVLPA